MITGSSCQKSGYLENSDLKIIQIYVIRNRKYHSVSPSLAFCCNILFSAETLLSAPWVCRLPSRKSDIRSPQCGNAINARHGAKALGESCSGVQAHCAPHHQQSRRLRSAILHPSALPPAWREKRSRIKSWFGVDIWKHRSCQTWWIFCFFACCRDCTASLVKVSKNTGCTPSFPIFSSPLFPFKHFFPHTVDV